MTQVRRLGDHDVEAARRLSGLAFGYPVAPRDPAQPSIRDGALDRWGAFDESGRLVATATDLHHEQWWGGRTVPASGIASVAVEPEQRGRGVTRELLAAALHSARARGAAVSSLFCTS